MEEEEFKDIPEGQVRPPLEGVPEEAPMGPSRLAPEAIGKPGWPPLKPVAVMPILRGKNEYWVYRTGWSAFHYTEKEEADISELIEACGITAPAWAQLLGAIVGRDAMKFVEWRALRASGKLSESKGGE